LRLKQLKSDVLTYQSGFRLIAALVLLIFCLLGVRDRTAEASDSFKDGVTAAREGQLSRAVELWTVTLRADPKCYAAYVNRGTAYIKSGHVMHGIRDWHAAGKYAPLFAYAYCSDDFIDQAVASRAELNYAKSLELDPDHVTSVTMMGVAYLDLGKTDMTVELYRKAIDLTKNPLLKNHLFYWIKSIEEAAGSRRRSR
jgi:Tfp pilus assembly protein PilF